MRWFSRRRSPSPRGGHAMVSSVAACCVRRSYSARYYALSMGMTQQFFLFFLFLVTLIFDLWPWLSNSGKIFAQSTYSVSFIVLCLVARKLSCGQTHCQAQWQTNRRRWKQSPRFATLRRWVIIIILIYEPVRQTTLLIIRLITLWNTS